MNDLLNTLFGLDGLGFGDPETHLGFARPLPGWAWMLAITGAGLVAWWSYWRLDASGRVRAILAGLRALVLILLVVIVAGPRLVRPNIVVEPDWVVVLVDRSASMTLRDVGEAPRETREEQLASILAATKDMWSSLAGDRHVVWLGFDAGNYDLSLEDGLPVLDEPDGTRTSLGTAIDQALRRAAARPVSALVIISDGRSIDELSREAISRLEADRIPIFTVALGRDDPLADLSVAQIEAPRTAFVDDPVPVHVEIERFGAGAWPEASVQLLNDATGRVLDEQPLEAPPDESDARVTLRAAPGEPGERRWSVRVVTHEPDLVASNNAAVINIELVDRPLRVLYLDGYPRWEQRYLKNLLLREDSIESSALLIAASRQYIQEGDHPIAAVPRSPEEWASFDVVVIGDVRADLFSTQQLEQLREHVAVRGAGLLWVAGPGATPHTWRGTPLDDLLPFTADARAQQVDVYDEPVTMVPAEPAARLGLLRLSEDGRTWPAFLSDPRTGWSRLRYAQRVEPGQLKPATEVLAQAVPLSVWDQIGSPQEAGTPLVMSMRYGAGRVIYVATDEIWRWRFGRGETLPERFWLPLIRLQGRESLARSGASATLEAAPRRAQLSEPVRIVVRLLDASLLEPRPESLTVAVHDQDEQGIPTQRLTLTPVNADAAGRAYAATWIPPAAGRYEVRAADPLLSGMGLTANVEVMLDDDELRHPAANHALLASMSRRTGGQTLTASELADLPTLMPRRQVEIAGEPEVETLWDRPIVLVILILLFTVEWVARRLLRLA